MEVGQIVKVKGSAFIAVASPGFRCQGCVGHDNDALCASLPDCVTPEATRLHFVRHDPNPHAQPWMPPLALPAPAACDIGPSVALSRKTDPVTSKGKRKVNKYEQAVLDCLIGSGSDGRTGKDIAYRTGHQLNCITPRFAPLRRKGLIKDSGTRRDKQIVWVLT